MKTLRIIAIIVFAAKIFCLQAQTITIHKVNGAKLEYHCGEVDSIVNYQIMPETEKHEAVDLGLSVLWATCNVGAEKPFQGGYIYGWGETEPRKEGEAFDYWFYTFPNEYIDIGQNISGTIYDAARQEWGGDWRMPTKEEMEELMNECTWNWVRIGSECGYAITGPNGNQIVLPATGYYHNTGSYTNTYRYSGGYWISNLRYEWSAWYLSIYGYYNIFDVLSSNKNELSSSARNSNYASIRPVKNK